MKRFLRVCVPILLALCIIAGIAWYLFFYDKGLTQDILLSGARFFRDQGNVSISSWFYDRAYDQKVTPDEIAIEKASQFIKQGNYTQAEIILTTAIHDGGGVEVYVALSDVFVKQDKLMDAVNLLDQVSVPAIKEKLDALRPQPPQASYPHDQTYNTLISVSLQAEQGQRIYVSTNGKYPSVKTDFYTQSIQLQQGFTDMQIVAVSENGLVSPLSKYGYTVVGVIEEVFISDAAMDQHIRSGLGLTNRQPILTSDLWKITQFTIPADATDYHALSYMIYLESLTVESGIPGQFSNLKNVKSLKTLSVRNTALTQEDANVIGSLTSLENLTLDDCRLTTSAPLASLISLKHLDLSNNDIGDISAILSMSELSELNMHRNALKDLSAIAGCKKLTVLDISNNSITSVAALSGLINLTHLNISHNQIFDISPLAACNRLKDFRANNNSISDITALAVSVSLEYVDISSNSILSIDPLSSIKSITYLNFSHNQVAQLPLMSRSCKLITIDGSYNLITDLAPLSGLENLNNILMDYNEGLESVANLASCPVLIQVNVYGTKVSDVTMLTSQSIIVNYNPIEAIED